MAHRYTAVAALAVMLAACGGKRGAYEPAPEVVAEVNALLADDDAIIEFANDAWRSGERLERFLRGAPDETAVLTVRASRLLAARAGAAGDDHSNSGHTLGRLIALLRRHVREHGDGALGARLRAAYERTLGSALEPREIELGSERELAADVARMHVEVVEKSYWEALDPEGLRGRVRNSPALDALEARWSQFQKALSAGLVSRE